MKYDILLFRVAQSRLTDGKLLNRKGRRIVARIFRHQYTAIGPDGHRVKKLTTKWYVEYRDEHGKKHRVPGYRDRIATQRLATKLEHDVILRLRGERTQDKPDFQFTPLSEHLADYIRWLTDQRVSERHYHQAEQLVKKILKEIGAKYPGELRRDALERYLADRRRAGNSAATSNHHLKTMRAFTRWLVREGRLHEEPFAAIRPLHVDSDRRRIRRALSDDEFARLIAAARQSPDTIRGLDGTHRAMLYLIAGFTGLRRGELLSLTPASFNLDGTPPTVTVEARHSKHRKRDVVPLPKWLADELRPWLADKAGKLWTTIQQLRTAICLRHDLAAAGVPVKDGQGRVCDFHSLRHYFVTSLARNGVGLVIAQRLARHSDPRLTANVYSAINMDEMSAAVESLPRPTS